MQAEEYRILAQIEDQHWWYRGKRKLIEDLICGSFNNVGALMILDIGCGTGSEAEMLQQFGTVIACDMEPFALTMTRKRGVEFVVQTSGTRFPFQDAQFDLIVASEVFEHIENDQEFVANLARLLKPGGALIFTVPAHQYLFSKHDERVHHVRRYSAQYIRKVIEEAGLSLPRVAAYNVLLSAPVVVYRLLSKILPIEGSDHAVAKDSFVNTLFWGLMRTETVFRNILSRTYGTTFYGVAKKRYSSNPNFSEMI